MLPRLLPKRMRFCVSLFGILGLLTAGCGGGSGSATVFEVTIENIATPSTLVASNGIPVPVVFSPFLAVIHDPSLMPIFLPGESASMELEKVAEDGDISTLSQSLSFTEGVRLIGIASTPRESESPSALGPGDAYRLLLSVDSDRARLSLVSSFVQGNDLFVSAPAEGIALFDENGVALSGDITASLTLFDAGTEVNQEPGFGADQSPRQAEPNSGVEENGVVNPVDDGFFYPAVPAMLRVTVNVIGEFDN